jgi:hypothetical protein
MRALWLAVLIVAGAAASPWALSIDLYATRDFTSCNLSLPNGSGSHFYVVVTTTGVTDSIRGGELRLDGVPDDWTVISLPSLGSFSAGSLFGAEGAQLTFDRNYKAPHLFLYTVLISAHSARNDVVIRVRPRAEPSFGLSCPMAYLAGSDPPAMCAEGGSLFINSTLDCNVGVQPSSWSAVRRLYQ